jgi:hypothetical protein
MTDVRVRAVCRVRPLTARDVELADGRRDEVLELGTGSTRPLVRVLTERSNVRDASQMDTTVREFEFDGVAGPEASQEGIYEAYGRPLVAGVVRGERITILAYGQTGSGKTHTITGGNSEGSAEDGSSDPRAPAEEGIAPRFIRDLAAAASGCVLTYMFVELSGTHVRDLSTGAVAQSRRTSVLPLSRAMSVGGIEPTAVDSGAALVAAYRRGCARRQTRSTGMNDTSSRSHAIFTVLVEGRGVYGAAQIVDLAGSECVEQAGLGALAETRFINQSLNDLRNHLASVRATAAGATPPRGTGLLTRLVGGAFGETRTLVIVTCAPGVAHTAATVGALRFGSDARQVDARVRINRHRGDLRAANARIVELEARVRDLEAELAAVRAGAAVATQPEDATSDSEAAPPPPLPPLPPEAPEAPEVPLTPSVPVEPQTPRPPALPSVPEEGPRLPDAPSVPSVPAGPSAAEAVAAARVVFDAELARVQQRAREVAENASAVAATLKRAAVLEVRAEYEIKICDLHSQMREREHEFVAALDEVREAHAREILEHAVSQSASVRSTEAPVASLSPEVQSTEAPKAQSPETPSVPLVQSPEAPSVPRVALSPAELEQRISEGAQALTLALRAELIRQAGLFELDRNSLLENNGRLTEELARVRRRADVLATTHTMSTDERRAARETTAKLATAQTRLAQLRSATASPSATRDASSALVAAAQSELADTRGRLLAVAQMGATWQRRYEALRAHIGASMAQATQSGDAAQTRAWVRVGEGDPGEDEGLP